MNPGSPIFISPTDADRAIICFIVAGLFFGILAIVVHLARILDALKNPPAAKPSEDARDSKSVWEDGRIGPG